MDFCKAAAGRSFRYFILLTLLFAAVVAEAQSEWTSLTSFRTVRRMRPVGDTVFMVTSGGLLAVTGPNTPGRAYLNTDGLGTCDLTDMLIDASGQKWLTGLGRLIKFDPDSSKVYPFRDGEGDLIRLNCAVDDGNFLWVGTDVGLVRFDKVTNGGQIQDSYTMFGDLNANPAVRAILIDGNRIWLATSVGLATADRSVPNQLKAPANWTVFDAARYPVFRTSDMYTLAKLGATVYVGTYVGLYRFGVSGGGADTSFVQTGSRPSAKFADLQVVNDSLFFYCTDWRGGYGGNGFVTPAGAYGLLNIDSLPTMPVTGARVGARRWLAALGGGVFYNDPGYFIEFPYTGTPGDNVTDVAVREDSQVVGAFYVPKAAGFSGDVWDTVTVGGAWTTNALFDSLGRAWVGSYGNGLWMIDDDTAINFDEQNSALIGNSENDRYVVISGLATDDRYLYAAAYRAVNGKPIVIADLDNSTSITGWTSFGTAKGLTTDRPTDLAVYDTLIAVATENNGVFIFAVGPDPFYQADYSVRQFTRENSGLPSNSVFTVRFSLDGLLWAGTNAGLAWFDYGLDRFIPIDMPAGISSEISDISIDGRGNVWFATPRGLGRFDFTTEAFDVFTSLNSGLLAETVNAVTVDLLTHDVYIATPSGISVRASDIGVPQSKTEQVAAFPNPFVIRSSDDELRFNFSRTGTVRIYSIAGELVTEFPVNLPWTGVNASGRDVASGVYIFTITDQQGSVGTGKILLVRE